ncbi:class I SAM-dependent methyltransferase [Reyranella sp.]|uniref:class I SAM-dependent methyltransferase n=1 Tax=Reyranella sp. TaxID=1929291 RepID=UPI003D0B05C7
MNTEQSVADHYTHGTLETAILRALEAAGKNPDNLAHGDLAAIDEFHIGGRQATMDLATQIALPSGARVLDVGCGIGGPARFFASEFGWRIEGIDLTDEYVRVAEALSRRVGLGDKASFRQASATALPFADATFDGAYMLHVGMNIADKKAVFAEVRRVLRPGGVFAIYDVMRESDGAFAYPVPWSSEPATNAIAAATTYRDLLGSEGFTIEKERSRRDFAMEFFRQMRQRMAETAAKGGPPPPGLPILMGPTAPQKVANMIALLERGVISPTEIIARAVTP